MLNMNVFFSFYLLFTKLGICTDELNRTKCVINVHFSNVSSVNCCMLHTFIVITGGSHMHYEFGLMNLLH